MLKRIDFMGVFGVGKSTFYQQLLKARASHNKRKCWLSISEAKTQVALDFLSSQRGSWRNFLTKNLLKQNLNATVKPLLNHLMLGDLRKRSLWNSRVKYAEFLDLIVELAGLKSNPAPVNQSLLNFLAVGWIYSIFDDFVLLENSGIDQVVLFDESLCHKSLNLIYPDLKTFAKSARQYFSNLPLPAGVVRFELEPEEVLSRVKHKINQSGTFIMAYQNLSQSEILKIIKIQEEICSIGIEILNQRGVKILSINLKSGERSRVQNNLDLFQRFLSSEIRVNNE